MRRLVFATNNAHKLGEVRSILEGSAEVLGLRDIGCSEDIPENGETLEDNAWIKARYVHCKYGIDCFADDTGLEIEALGGRPGVRSARYAGEDCNADNNIKKVLEELKGETNRKARFRTVICLIEDGSENYFEGIVEGRIIDEKRGKEGFGYDPVFIPDGYSTTFAEMPLDAKNSISHRGRAIASLMAWLTRQGSPR
jgi:XTP/dITP diphosphohydrolase